MTQNNLGNALIDQAKLSQGAEAARLLVVAVTIFRAALEVRTRGQFPQDWAMTQSNLGTALRCLASQNQAGEAARLLAESDTAYRAALEIYNPDKFPNQNRVVSDYLALTEKALHQIRQ
jgi:hypothetical protein